MKTRCAWAGSDPLYVAYHDSEWGVPVYDDRELFEFLLLEGAQAGLSWITILRKRENYRQAFDGFDPVKIVSYDQAKIAVLLEDAGIVRNRLKINAAVKNARSFLQVQQAFGTFSSYIWGFVDHKQIQNHWHSLSEIPAETPLSTRISQDLKKRGFKFVGPTICYAFMQSVGMVNDHTTNCFRYAELGGSNASGTG